METPEENQSDFQILVKPVGAQCNLACRYCYSLDRTSDSAKRVPGRMPELLLEEYIVQHIEASASPMIRFSWHGGEPTLAGLDFFRRTTELQRRHLPSDSTLFNSMQTNGMLLNEEWVRFFSAENFYIGLSLDGPREMHNRFRQDRAGGPTYDRVLQAFELLKKNNVNTDILCVVHAGNVENPLATYRFLREIGASYITFLPLVEKIPGISSDVSAGSVAARDWGVFLCKVFDEWIDHDIGRLKVQIFEEAARTSFGLEHSLCIFRETCGEIPMLEPGGDLYSCDHFVDPNHLLGNILEIPLQELLSSDRQRKFGRAKKEGLPRLCRECDVLDLCHGECPKNRFIRTPRGEPGLNFLCEGYRLFFRHCRPFIEAVSSEWRRDRE